MWGSGLACKGEGDCTACKGEGHCTACKGEGDCTACEEGDCTACREGENGECIACEGEGGGCLCARFSSPVIYELVVPRVARFTLHNVCLWRLIGQRNGRHLFIGCRP